MKRTTKMIMVNKYFDLKILESIGFVPNIDKDINEITYYKKMFSKNDFIYIKKDKSTTDEVWFLNIRICIAPKYSLDVVKCLFLLFELLYNKGDDK